MWSDEEDPNPIYGTPKSMTQAERDKALSDAFSEIKDVDPKTGIPLAGYRGGNPLAALDPGQAARYLTDRRRQDTTQRTEGVDALEGVFVDEETNPDTRAAILDFEARKANMAMIAKAQKRQQWLESNRLGRAWLWAKEKTALYWAWLMSADSDPMNKDDEYAA